FWIARAFCAARAKMRSALRLFNRTDEDLLRTLVITAGLLWSIVFVALALQYSLQLYADGAMFSYAVAVRDVWAFHWHNISGRLSVFLLSLWPAETFVWLTGSPRGGIVIYGFLFYIAPLAGLIGTFAADRSRDRTIFAYACCSTALLCPLVFGFPTEMWIAHAIFWPCLALCHYSRRGFVGTALLAVTMAALVFSHEGALVLAFAIVLTLALRGTRDAFFLRAVIALGVVLGLWVAIKVIYPPDRYFGEVLIRAGLHFFDPTIFEAKLVILLLEVLAVYGFVFLVLSRLASGRTVQYGAVALVAVG